MASSVRSNIITCNRQNFAWQAVPECRQCAYLNEMATRIPASARSFAKAAGRRSPFEPQLRVDGAAVRGICKITDKV